MSRFDEPDEELVARATDLAEQDHLLHYALVMARRNAGLSVEDVGAILGWSVKKVRKFERYWNDPRQSHIRRYALAVGVNITHTAVVGRPVQVPLP